MSGRETFSAFLCPACECYHTLSIPTRPLLRAIEFEGEETCKLKPQHYRQISLHFLRGFGIRLFKRKRLKHVVQTREWPWVDELRTFEKIKLLPDGFYCSQQSDAFYELAGVHDLVHG